MNEELKQALQVFATDMIQKIQSGVDQGTTFVSAQAPLIMQEIVLRGIICAAVGMVGGIALLIVSIILVRKMIHLAKTDDAEWWMIVCIAIPLLCGGSFALFIYNLLNLFIRIFAPRIYLLEQLKALFM
jgi:hypothetical protein